MIQSDEWITAFAPATVANVACAFDILGFAVGNPGDEVMARIIEGNKVIISEITGDNNKLPLDVKKNTAGVAVTEYLSQIGEKVGIELKIKKGMPLGSGLGSSAASAAAALVAVNKLLEEPLSRLELVKAAMAGEKAACGVAHADNVAPALIGGFVLIRSYDPLDIIPINAPEDLHCAIVHPHIEIRTADARKILRREFPLNKIVIQLGNTAGLIAGLHLKDYDLIGRSLTDVLVEPERSLLIPGFLDAKNAVLENNALGCSISGSGPSIFALTSSDKLAKQCESLISDIYSSLDIECTGYISKINNNGAIIVSNSEATDAFL